MHQFVVGTDSHSFALVQNDDLVGIPMVPIRCATIMQVIPANFQTTLSSIASVL